MGHEDACSGSQASCDSVLAEYERKLPGSVRNEGRSWCTIRDAHGDLLAWVQHRKKAPRARVYPYVGRASARFVEKLEALGVHTDTARARTSWGNVAPVGAYVPDEVTALILVGVHLGVLGERGHEERVVGGAVDVDDDAEYREGRRSLLSMNRIERNARLRRACIRKFGTECAVCGMDFERRYGPIGEGFIHVHHLVPVAEQDAERSVKVDELRPVCPNCHAMLHQSSPPIALEELKRMLREP